MSKIRILAISPDTFGVGKFRILDPYTFLSDKHSDEFHVDISNGVEQDDSIFLNYDIVVFHSFIHNAPHEINVARVNWLKSKGIKVVMDTDDFWIVDRKHPMYERIKLNDLPRKRAELLRLADYVSCTTKVYAETIKKRLGVKNIVIFPNAIDETESQYQPNPIESDKIRFGWLGGSSHLHDIEIMRSGISTTLTNYGDKVQFYLCGFDTRGTLTIIDPATKKTVNRPVKPEETVWFKYEHIFTNNYKVINEDYKNYLLKFSQEETYDATNEQYVRVWTQPVTKYANNYNNFDVSLAPLLSNDFNMNKSQLKAIEAGFHKKALIASETLPYTLDLVNSIDQGKFTDGNALLVSHSKNHKQWAQHMKRLIDNPNMIEDLGNRLYETVKDTYSLRNVTLNRVEFFKSII